MLLVVFSILILTLLIFTIWNLVLSRRLSKNLSSSTPPINDSKYYELKYKQDFLVASFALIAGIAGLMGWNSLESIENKLQAEVKTKINESENRIDSLRFSVDSIGSRLNNIRNIAGDYDDRLKASEETQTQITSKSKMYNSQMSDLLIRINELNEKNILKQNIYIINDVFYSQREKGVLSGGYKKYFYRDLKTISGDKLPYFSKPPFILPVSRQGATVNIDSIGTESFYMTIWNQAPINIDALKYNESQINLIISEIPN